MTKNRAAAVLVTGPDADIMGIVTDHDFRERVVAESLDYGAAVRSIMTRPGRHDQGRRTGLRSAAEDAGAAVSSFSR